VSGTAKQQYFTRQQSLLGQDNRKANEMNNPSGSPLCSCILVHFDSILSHAYPASALVPVEFIMRRFVAARRLLYIVLRPKLAAAIQLPQQACKPETGLVRSEGQE